MARLIRKLLAGIGAFVTVVAWMSTARVALAQNPRANRQRQARPAPSPALEDRRLVRRSLRRDLSRATVRRVHILQEQPTKGRLQIASSVSEPFKPRWLLIGSVDRQTGRFKPSFSHFAVDELAQKRAPGASFVGLDKSGEWAVYRRTDAKGSVWVHLTSREVRDGPKEGPSAAP